MGGPLKSDSGEPKPATAHLIVRRLSMKINSKEVEELIEWGVRFFEMGFDACLKVIAKTGKFAKEQKVNAVRDFIASQPNKSTGQAEVCENCGNDKDTDIYCNHEFHQSQSPAGD